MYDGVFDTDQSVGLGLRRAEGWIYRELDGEPGVRPGHPGLGDGRVPGIRATAVGVRSDVQAGPDQMYNYGYDVNASGRASSRAGLP